MKKNETSALSRNTVAAHAAVARRAAAEGMVLLHNDGALPLSKGSSLAIFGAARLYKAGGGGSSQVKPSRVVSFEQGLAEAGFKVDPESRETALYVLFRDAAENGDMPRGEHDLSAAEKREMDSIRKMGFRRVVVVVNGGQLPNLAPWTRTGKVNAAIFEWFPGQEGSAALGDILCGAVNPSGRLADTCAAKVADWASDDKFLESPDYVPYEDDIFVGYRYFETAPGAKDKVVYPFGYGLSYTKFRIEAVKPAVIGKSRISASIRVTNTGKVAGSTSVLLYSSQKGGLAEHPAIELRTFGKTRVLKPGASQVLSLSFARNDLASFDDEGWSGQPGAWVLDRGRYRILAGGSVREVREVGAFTVRKAEILSVPGFKCRTDMLASRLRASGKKAALLPIVYNGQKGVDYRPFDQYPTESVARYKLRDVAKGKVSLDKFLDQMTLKELLALTHGHPAIDPSGTGGIGTLPKFGMEGAQTCDGPCGVRREKESTAFPCTALVACSFDPALVRSIGRVIGEEAAETGFDILLAPGLCIHRHPLCGRNFEYFSEDPVVSGMCAAAYVKGVQSTGVGATVKHFACNDRETNRRIASAVVGERALREIYLRGFERAIREAKPWAVMTSYNQINGLNSGAFHGLLEGILRGEWGFKGITMTDWYTIAPMWREICCGNDVKMSHDQEAFTPAAQWHTGIGEHNAYWAWDSDHATYSYLYTAKLRASARRVCRLVLASLRFRRSLKG